MWSCTIGSRSIVVSDVASREGGNPDHGLIYFFSIMWLDESWYERCVRREELLSTSISYIHPTKKTLKQYEHESYFHS